MIIQLQNVSIMSLSRPLLILSLLLASIRLTAQELFVYSEPASNMPAGSLGIRLSNWLDEEGTSRINYHFIPELMWGINKRLMIHTEGYFSNRSDDLRAE